MKRILVVVLVVILAWWFWGGRLSTMVDHLTLEQDGFQTHTQVLSPTEIASLREMDNKSVKAYIQSHPRVLEIIESLGPGYEFQDYVFILKKSSIHTCHRDANGDLFNEGQSHPSYTMLVFLEGSDNCLEVAPGSHD